MLQPVRVYMYGLLGPVVAILAFYGVVGKDAVPLWIALGSAVLGIGATETARSRVTPTADPRDDEGHPLTR